MLEIIQPFTPEWTPRALTCSALENEGIDQVWEVICDFREQMTASGVFQQRRSEQNLDWLRSRVRQALIQRFNNRNSQQIRQLEAAVVQGELSVSEAVDQLLDKF
jgi:LAO/AO transport system kinase